MSPGVIIAGDHESLGRPRDGTRPGVSGPGHAIRHGIGLFPTGGNEGTEEEKWPSHPSR